MVKLCNEEGAAAVFSNFLLPWSLSPSMVLPCIQVHKPENFLAFSATDLSLTHWALTPLTFPLPCMLSKLVLVSGSLHLLFSLPGIHFQSTPICIYLSLAFKFINKPLCTYGPQSMRSSPLVGDEGQSLQCELCESRDHCVSPGI